MTVAPSAWRGQRYASNVVEGPWSLPEGRYGDASGAAPEAVRAGWWLVILAVGLVLLVHFAIRGDA